MARLLVERSSAVTDGSQEGATGTEPSPTTAKQRAAWLRTLLHGVVPQPWRDRFRRLIADVERQSPLVEQLVAAVEEYHQGLAPNKRLPHKLCVICDLLRRVREARDTSVAYG